MKFHAIRSQHRGLMGLAMNLIEHINYKCFLNRRIQELYQHYYKFNEESLTFKIIFYF